MTLGLRRSPGRRVEVDGLRLHVVDEGAGAPVLLLHGFTGCGENLASLAAELREDGRRTLLLDLIGHGRSDAPVDRARYRMERCVDDVARVLASLGVGRADVFGYSMGGRVALALAVRHPGRVRSAVLVGASAGIADPAERAARVEADEKLAASLLSDGIPAFVERWMAQPLFATQRRVARPQVSRERRLRLKNRPHALALSLQGMGAGVQPPLHAALSAVRLPVLLVAGADDPKFVALARELAARLPQARAAIVPDAGHSVQLEQPEALSRLVRSFLRSPETPGGEHGPRDPRGLEDAP